VPASHQLTIRDVNRQLRAALEREARRRGLSLNRTVLALLAESTGLTRLPQLAAREHHDLDELAGTWSEQQAREFDEALAEQRGIDGRLWR
jgi:hypothetical protein